MDILTNYRDKITELTNELHHYVHQYNIILKERKQEQKNTVNINKRKERKSPQKDTSL